MLSDLMVNYMINGIKKTFDLEGSELKEKVIGDKKVNIYGRPATSSFVRLALVEHNFIYRLIYADNTNFFKKYNLGARGIPNIVGGFVLDDLDEWNMICDKKIKPMVSNRNYFAGVSQMRRMLIFQNI